MLIILIFKLILLSLLKFIIMSDNRYSRDGIYYNDFRVTLEKLTYDVFNLEDKNPDVYIFDNTMANHINIENIDLDELYQSEMLTYDDALHLLIYLSEHIVCNGVLCTDRFKNKIKYCLNETILDSLGTYDTKTYWEYISDSIEKWFKGEELVDIFIEYELNELHDERHKEMVKYYAKNAFKEGEYNLLTNGREVYLSFNNPELYEKCKRFFFIDIIKHL